MMVWGRNDGMGLEMLTGWPGGFANCAVIGHNAGVIYGTISIALALSWRIWRWRVARLYWYAQRN